MITRFTCSESDRLSSVRDFLLGRCVFGSVDGLLWVAVLAGLCLTLSSSVLRADDADRATGEGDKVIVFADDFTSGNAGRWMATDPGAWKFEEHEGRPVFSQHKQSRTQNAVRCPFNRAIVRGLALQDFQLDVDFQSTARDYPHRSLCLFFGYQDPSHFYYVHFGQRTDDHANQIFVVNDAPRTKISTKTTDGTPWDNNWHHARIVRRASTGEISIYFDDMETPVMTANDETFLTGSVGLGSFDDTGRFANLEVRELDE